MDKQLVKLKRFHEHFVGVQAQMIDVVVLCHMSTRNCKQVRVTDSPFRTKLAGFFGARTMEGEGVYRGEHG